MLAMIAITASCGACVLIYPGLQVGPNFRVRVQDHGRSVQGLRVEIAGRTNTFAYTDRNGFALFRDVPPGSYHLSASHDAGIPDGYELEVKLDKPAEVTVPLKWPNSAPVRVRSMKGVIRGPGYLPGQTQPRLSLDLLEGSSGRKLKSFETTDSGEFNVESAAPGLYFLSLNGLIAVVVDPAAPADHMDIDLGWTSCGLWYADRSQCPQSDFQIQQLSGQVLDASGAAIPDAKILLLDRAGKLVERLRSDSAGEFKSPRSLAGIYELVVSAAGFTPLHATLHPGPSVNPARVPALTVELGVSGICGSAETGHDVEFHP